MHPIVELSVYFYVFTSHEGSHAVNLVRNVMTEAYYSPLHSVHI